MSTVWNIGIIVLLGYLIISSFKRIENWAKGDRIMFSLFILFLIGIEVASLLGFRSSPYYDMINIFFLGSLFGYIFWYYTRLKKHEENEQNE